VYRIYIYMARGCLCILKHDAISKALKILVFGANKQIKKGFVLAQSR